uniref:CMP-N-acetylneuraminate-beta-galactosamide- alpha-2,3-sialyltransferase 1-like isoform X1 n=1 Tax=Myxine glutinosa TaxID=7769 RepID=UPI00358E97DF
MAIRVKLFFGILAIGTFSCSFLFSMVNRYYGLNILNNAIVMSIFGERNDETGFSDSCPMGMTNSSHLSSFFKQLCNRDTYEEIRNNRSSPWFVKRSNTSIRPFLSPLSQRIAREDFNWWQKLQKNDISYEAFLDFLRKWDKVLPNSELLFKEKRSICTSCAVVGNSQNLNGSGFGKAIDCHDYVFRMNRGPVEGFENDVGTFTTHRFMYPESATKVPPGTGLIFIPFKMRDLIWLNNTLMKVSNEEKNINATERKKVIVYNPAFMHYVHNNWGNKKGHYPSTGLFAIISVLHSCDKVDVFGFGQNSHGAWPHYWDKRYKEKKGQVYVHNAGNEREMLERLKDNGIIRMFGKT